jgi:hypothetical protein
MAFKSMRDIYGVSKAFDSAHVRTFRIACIVPGVIAIAWAIAIILVGVFQCTPITRA